MAILNENINFVWYGDSCDSICEPYNFYIGANLRDGFQNVISVAQIKTAGFVFSNWSYSTDIENRESYEKLPDIIKNNLPKDAFVKDSQGFDSLECGKAYIVKLVEGTQLDIPGAVVVNLGSTSTRLLENPCPTCPDPDDCGCTKVNLIFLNSQTRTGWTEQLSACMDFTTGTPLELFSSTTSLSVGTKLYLEERQYQDDGFSVSNQWVVANGILYRINGRSIVEIVDCEDIIPTPTPTPEFETPADSICITDSTFDHFNGDYPYTGQRYNSRPVWGPNDQGAYIYYANPASETTTRWILSRILGSRLGYYANAGEFTDYPYDVDWDGSDIYSHTISTEVCPTPTPTPFPEFIEPDVFYIDICTTMGQAHPSYPLGDAVSVNGKPVYFNFREIRNTERWDNYADYLIRIRNTHSPVVLGEHSRIETSASFDALNVEVSMYYESTTEEIQLAFGDHIAYFFDQDESQYGIGTDTTNYTQTLSKERTPEVSLDKTTQHGDVVMSNYLSDSVTFFERNSDGKYIATEDFHLGDTVSKNSISGDTAVHSLRYMKQNSWGESPEQLVVVYKKVNGTWQESQRLHPPEEHRDLPYASDTYFGQDVDITSSGDILITTINGAPGTNSDGSNRVGIGALYVFRPDQGGVYQYVQYIQPDNLNNMAYFGQSVSSSGDFVVVGSHDYQISSPGYSEPLDQGTAFVYQFDTSSSNYVLKARVEGDDPIPDQHILTQFGNFGWSVAINGDWLVVGAPATLNSTDQNLPRPTDANPNTHLFNPGATGATYVYKRSGTAWNRHQKLNLGENAFDKHFGFVVDISDDYLVVTACENRYVYTLVVDSWELYSASNSFESGSCLAHGSVSTHGETLVHGTNKGAVVTDLSWYAGVCTGFDSTMPTAGLVIWPLLCGTGEFIEIDTGINNKLCSDLPPPPSPTPTPTPLPPPVECWSAENPVNLCVSGITGAYAIYNGTYIPDIEGDHDHVAQHHMWSKIDELHQPTQFTGQHLRVNIHTNFQSGMTGYVKDDKFVSYESRWVFTSRGPNSDLDYFVAQSTPPMISEREYYPVTECPHESNWESVGVDSVYFENMKVVSDNCPDPIPEEFVFRKIEFSANEYAGWDDDSLLIACTDAESGQGVDSLILYRNYDASLDIGTKLRYPDIRFGNYFSVKDEWVWSSGALFKISGDVITDIIDCDEVPTPTPVPIIPPWCGEPPTADTYICVQGSAETAGQFNRAVDGRYYYSLQSGSDKTEWQSRNSLIYIVFLTKTDPRNSLGLDVWAFYADSGTKHGILYYTQEFDPDSYCPPLETTYWVPTGQMSSRLVSIYGYNNCGNINIDKIPCDVKDASMVGWFNISGCKNTLTVNQSTAQASDSNCNKNFKKYGDEFGVVIKRGSGTNNVAEVHRQTSRGNFTINSSSITPPGVGWYDYPGERPNACGTYEHIIEIPFTKAIDLVSLKILTKTDRRATFDVQVFSVDIQRWVKLGDVSHTSDHPTHKVSEFKNSKYYPTNPPLDGSDVISHSVSGIRLYVGNWNYTTSRGSAISNLLGSSPGGMSLTLHSIRVEGRDSSDCLPEDVTRLHETSSIVSPIQPRSAQAPTLYPASVVIIGEKCIGTRLHGNYRYDGTVQDIIYEWNVNGITHSTYRYLDTNNLSQGDTIEFVVTFKYLETKSTTYRTSIRIDKCKTLLARPHTQSGTFVYSRKSTLPDGVPEYEGWPTYLVCDHAGSARRIKMWWSGNLGVGTKFSLETSYQTHESINGTNGYVYHVEGRRALRLTQNKSVSSIHRCPARDIFLSPTTMQEKLQRWTHVGVLSTSPDNTSLRFSLVSGPGDDHNSLLSLSGRDTANNVHNMNVTTNDNILSYGMFKSLHIRVRATLLENNSIYCEKRFIITVTPKPVEYLSCHKIRIDGLSDPVLNGVYSPVVSSSYTSLSSTYIEASHYETSGGKYVYRTALYTGTNKYAKLQWNSYKDRWEIFIKTDPSVSSGVTQSTSSALARLGSVNMHFLMTKYGIQPRTTNPTGIFFNNKTIATTVPVRHSPTGHGHKSCPFPFQGVVFYCTDCTYDSPEAAEADRGTVTDAGRMQIGRDYRNLG